MFPQLKKKRYDRPLAITRNTNNSNVNESCDERKKGGKEKRGEKKMQSASTGLRRALLRFLTFTWRLE